MKKESLKNIYRNICKKLKSQFKHNKISYVWIGFFVLGFLLLVNVFIMFLHLADNDYEYKILNQHYVGAILPNQDINQDLKVGVVHIEEFDINKIETGDQVIINGDFDLDENWVETVVSVDINSLLVVATYDEAISNQFTSSDVIGVYISNANFFGSIYYTASFLKGFIFLTLSHILIPIFYWYVIIYKRKPVSNEDEKRIIV